MQNRFSLQKSCGEDMVLIWDRVNVLKRSECPSAVCLNCRFVGNLLKPGMFKQIRAQSRKALSLLSGKPAVARKFERQPFSLKSYVSLLISLQKVCPLSPEGIWVPPPATSSAFQGYSPGPLSCCEVCACTTENLFSCGFNPCQLFFSSLPLICPDSFVEGAVQQNLLTGQGESTLALWRCTCWRNVICLCFILHWGLTGHCGFCDQLGCCRRQNIWLSTEVCNASTA